MSITLSDGTTTVALHEDLYWIDENNWNPVEQTAKRTITGALIVSTAARVGGRPITLQPFDESSAWMASQVVEQLRNWAAVPGKQFTLTLRSVAHTVIFRHQDEPAFEATPLLPYSDVESDDFYLVTLRFMEL